MTFLRLCPSVIFLSNQNNGSIASFQIPSTKKKVKENFHVNFLSLFRYIYIFLSSLGWVSLFSDVNVYYEFITVCSFSFSWFIFYFIDSVIFYHLLFHPSAVQLWNCFYATKVCYKPGRLKISNWSAYSLQTEIKQIYILVKNLV